MKILLGRIPAILSSVFLLFLISESAQQPFALGWSSFFQHFPSSFPALSISGSFCSCPPPECQGRVPRQGAPSRAQHVAPCPPFCSHPTALMKSCVLVGFLGFFFFKSWCTIVNGQVTRTALEFLSVLEGLFVTGQKIPLKSSKKKSSLFNFWGDLKDSRCLRKNLDLCYL